MRKQQQVQESLHFVRKEIQMRLCIAEAAKIAKFLGQQREDFLRIEAEEAISNRLKFE